MSGLMQPGPTLYEAERLRQQRGSQGLLGAVGEPLSYAPGPVGLLGNALLGARYLTGEAPLDEGLSGLAMMTGLLQGTKVAPIMRNAVKAAQVTKEQLKQTREAQRHGIGLDIVPEDMFKHETNKGIEHSGVYQYAAEHIGDLVHRLSHSDDIGGGVAYGIESALEKASRNYFRDSPIAQAKRNYKWFVENMGYKGTEDQFIKEMRDAGKRYADSYRKIPVYTKPQQLGRDAAVSLGEMRFGDVQKNLNELKKMLDVDDAESVYLKALDDASGLLGK